MLSHTTPEFGLLRHELRAAYAMHLVRARCQGFAPMRLRHFLRCALHARA